MSRLDVIDCIFTGNSNPSRSASSASIRFSPLWPTPLSVIGCLFADNHCGYIGAAISAFQAIPLRIDGCTFINNTADSAGGAVIISETDDAVVRNSIFWGNDSPQARQLQVQLAWNVEISYCDIEGGREEIVTPYAELTWGPGNIDAEPRFVSDDVLEHHLQPDSPCVNAGTAEPGYVVDLDGDYRPNAGRVDIGADEVLILSGVGLEKSAGSGWYIDSYQPGDVVYLNVYAYNRKPTHAGPLDLFVVLDLGTGDYWFWPGWGRSPDWLRLDVLRSHRTIRKKVIEPFTWPSGMGTYQDAGFWAALVEPDHERIFGEYDYVPFKWEEWSARFRAGEGADGALER